MLGACSLGCWWMLFSELDGRVLGGCSLGCCGCCFASWPGMLLCELDGRVLGGMQFEVLVDAALRA